MSDPAHKAHRPSQSGKKAEKKDAAQGKDRSGGKGFNEKVRILGLAQCSALMSIYRPSPRPPSVRPTCKLVVPLKRIRNDSTSHLSTVLQPRER